MTEFTPAVEAEMLTHGVLSAVGAITPEHRDLLDERMVVTLRAARIEIETIIQDWQRRQREAA